GSGHGARYTAPGTGAPQTWPVSPAGARREGAVVDFYGEPVEGKVVHIANGFGLDDQETSATNGGFSWVLDYPFAGAFSAKLSPVPATVAVNIHPVADNLDNDTGTVSGGNTVVISGGGFRKQHTVVRFACGKAHVDVTPKSISLNALSRTTPASPCGKGAAAATVTVLVDGLQSLPLTWHYIIPDQPVLTFLPGCFPSQPIFSALQVNAYQADGSLSSEQITLTAPYAAFNNHTSQQITIASNTQVSMVGSGPITATPVNKPQLAVTGQWPAPVPDASCIPRLPQPVTVHVFDPGIVESVGVQPELVETRQGTLATWMLPAAENANAGSLVQLATPTVRAAARTDQLLSVRALGADELLRLYTDHSTLLSRGRGDARLGGAAFSIDFAAEELRGGTLLGDFVRPVDVTAEVAWLADSPGSAWVVIP
ncbi:MAG: IPT/TIG domain-containing protein, partial [Deltaproteobacteria bacterium]|nr:IPT/TIG domain-containing protein [Deltaproteobacteria bacterium]